jgi:hypothetical protein
MIASSMVTVYLKGIKLRARKDAESEKNDLIESMKSNADEKQILLCADVFIIDKTHLKTRDIKCSYSQPFSTLSKSHQIVV